MSLDDAIHNILSSGKDTPGKLWLENWAKRQRDTPADKPIEPIPDTWYRCQRGHVTARRDMDRERDKLGCCPKCPHIDPCVLVSGPYNPLAIEPIGNGNAGPSRFDPVNDAELQGDLPREPGEDDERDWQ